MAITLLAIVGYIFGSVPFSYLAGRYYGVDIRTVGTRAASPGNVWRSVGHLSGVATGVAEVAKGIIPMLAARTLTGDDLAVLLVGLAAIAGHNWPIFLGFDGGRGASLGLVTMLLVSYQWLGLALVPLAALTIALRDSAPAILAAFVLAPAFAVLLGFPQPVVVAAIGIPALTILRRVTARMDTDAVDGHRWTTLGSRLIFDRPERQRKRPQSKPG